MELEYNALYRKEKENMNSNNGWNFQIYKKKVISVDIR